MGTGLSGFAPSGAAKSRASDTRGPKRFTRYVVFNRFKIYRAKLVELYDNAASAS